MELKQAFLATAAGLVAIISVACGGTTTTTVATQETETAPSATPVEVASVEVTSTTEPTVGNEPTTGAERTALGIPELVVRAEPSIVRVQSNNSIGTGFIVSEDGYIITNDHVVESALALGVVTVTLHDGSELEATIVGTDARSDIALLKVEMDGLIALTFVDLDDIAVGQSVVAIGFPLDLERGEGSAFTVTTGIVSAKNRQFNSASPIFGAIQTDAAINSGNSGNSGGPLINLYGEVVGVTTAIAINQNIGTAAAGIGFAVGSDTVAAVYDELREDGTVDRALLGISDFDALSPAAARSAGVPEDTEGVLVRAVSDGGPVGRAGLLAGDIITSIGRFAIPNESKLAEALVVLDPGDEVVLTVYRDGLALRLDVTLGDAALGQ